MNYVALHLDGNELKLAHIQGDKKSFNLLKTASFSHHVKLLDILPKINSYNLITGIDSWNLFLREFSFNLRFKREILSILPFQIESQFPYPLDQLVLAPIFHPKKESVTVVSLFALTKQQLGQHINYFQDLNLDPDVISTIPTALFRFASHFYPELSSAIVYHLGVEKSSICALTNEKIVFSQTQNFGAASSSLDLFEKDLDRICSYIRKKTPSITNLILCGEPHQNLPFFKTLLEKHFSVSDSKEKYAIPIGLCLDAMKRDKNSVQFRTGAFLPAKRSAIRMVHIKHYLIASCCLFLIALVGGQFFIRKKEKDIFAELTSVYTVPQDASLEKATEEFDHFISKNKLPLSFSLTVPKVSDLLVWISNHPKLKDGEISISKIHYQLEKHPNLDNPTASTEAHVEMEFSSSSPRAAREFHDALMKDNSFINSKKEIGWTANQDHYRAAFYLNPVKGRKTS